MEPAPIGHVSRARLLEAGSVAARRYARAASEAPQELDGQAPDVQDEPAQITWPELWDARLLAGHVARSIAAATSSGQHIGDAWPRSGRQQKAARQVVQYSRTLAGAQAHKRRRVDDAGDYDTPQVVVQDGAVRPEDVPCELPAAHIKPWRCRCAQKPACADDDDAQPQVCGFVNRFCEDRCAACDAARWDGPHGQLFARVAATLQTSDLNATSMRQLKQRLSDEQASHSGTGLACSTEDVARLVKQYLSKHSTYGMSAQPPAGTSTTDGEALARRDSPGLEMVDDELLQSMGCPPEAMEVYNVLLAMLQQQQQQQQQQEEVDTPGISGAPAQPPEQQGIEQQQQLAAHLAATSVTLLKALVQPHIQRTQRKQNKHKHMVGTRGQWKLHEAAEGRMDKLKWLGQQLDRGFLGQEHDALQHQAQQDESDTAEPPAERRQALRRGLPAATIATVLDPVTAASRAALNAFSMQGRHLPHIRRVYSSQESEELGQDVMLPSQWLFRNEVRHSKAGTTCKARRAARFAGSGDTPVVVQRQADWQAVNDAMAKVQALLLQHNPIDEAAMLAAWASHPPWELRRRLHGAPLPSWASSVADIADEYGQDTEADGKASASGVATETPGQLQRQLGSSVWRPYAAARRNEAGDVASRPDTSAAGAVPADDVGGMSTALLPQDVQEVLHNALALGVRKTVLDKAAARVSKVLCNHNS